MRTRDKSATVQLSKVRIKEPLRAALERDAEARGLTMNAVIADRLEQSFRTDLRFQDLREVFAIALGSDAAAITLAIGLAIRDVVRWYQLPPKINLLSDPFVFDQARTAILSIIDSVKPDGDTAAPPGGAGTLPGTEAVAEQWRTLGLAVGEQVCRQIANYPEQLGPWGSAIQEWLGHDTVERLRAKLTTFYGGH
jgi:hypothetical protein